MCLTMNIDIISDDVLVARVDGGVLAAIERAKGKKVACAYLASTEKALSPFFPTFNL